MKTDKLLTIMAAAALVAACRKPEPPPPAPPIAVKPPPPVATSPAPANPPPVVPPVALEIPAQAPAPSAPAGSSFEVAGAKVDRIEGWIIEYQTGDAAKKGRILSAIRIANLTPAERALLDETCRRYGYATMPK